VVAVSLPHANERNPDFTVVEKAILLAPAVGVTPFDGLTAFAAEALYDVTVSSTDTSENGKALTSTFIGMDVPFIVHVAELGTLIVALALVTYTKKVGNGVKLLADPSSFLNVA